LTVTHNFSALGLNTPSLVKKPKSLRYLLEKPSNVSHKGNSAHVLNTAMLTTSLCASCLDVVQDQLWTLWYLFTQERLLTRVKTYRKFLCSDIFPVIFATFHRSVCWQAGVPSGGVKGVLSRAQLQSSICYTFSFKYSIYVFQGNCTNLIVLPGGERNAFMQRLSWAMEW